MNVILIDGRNSIFRFSWTRRQLTNGDGKSTGAIWGLLSAIVGLRRRYGDARFVVCWDGKDSHRSWRNSLYPSYKQHRRTQTYTPEQLAMRKQVGEQITTLKKMLYLLNVCQIEVAELEADDVVGVMADKIMSKGHQPVVYSNDQDYLQLVARGVKLINGVSSPALDKNHISIKFHCDSEDVLKVRALTGDKSDGIPRPVPGVGPISAARYVRAGLDPACPTFENLPQHVRASATRMKAYWTGIHLNYRLMRILSSCYDAELPLPVAAHFSVETRRVLKELAAPRKRDREEYGCFVGMLTELDLLSLFNNRLELWGVQNARSGRFVN